MNKPLSPARDISTPALGGRFPVVTIGPVTLIRGDALAVLRELEGGADLVVTDPPYKLTSGGKNAQVMSGKFASHRYDNSGLLMQVVPWEAMGGPILRACKASADAYVMTNDKNLHAAQTAFQGSGWRFHNLLVWNKGAPTRNRWFMKNLEFTLYLFKGRARTINMPGSTQLFSCPRPKDAIHPTQKPVELLAHYILNSSSERDQVLDPFSGSGSTLVAAMQTGRHGIGIELDPEMFEASAARIRMEWESLQRAQE